MFSKKKNVFDFRRNLVVLITMATLSHGSRQDLQRLMLSKQTTRKVLVLDPKPTCSSVDSSSDGNQTSDVLILDPKELNAPPFGESKAPKQVLKNPLSNASAATWSTAGLTIRSFDPENGERSGRFAKEIEHDLEILMVSAPGGNPSVIKRKYFQIKRFPVFAVGLKLFAIVEISTRLAHTGTGSTWEAVSEVVYIRCENPYQIEGDDKTGLDLFIKNFQFSKIRSDEEQLDGFYLDGKKLYYKDVSEVPNTFSNLAESKAAAEREMMQKAIDAHLVQFRKREAQRARRKQERKDTEAAKKRRDSEYYDYDGPVCCNVM